jgi:hypothetical protein
MMTATVIVGEGEKEYSKYLERAKKEEETFNELQKSVESTKGEFSVEQTRQTLGKIKNRTQRLTAMSQIAITLAENGKTDEAKEMINDARKMLIAPPKFWAHYIEHLMVARALASIDPKQSLAMLENLVFQIDDTIGGMSKVAEFIAGETAIKENELRLSGIPGMVGVNIFSQVGRGGGAQDFITGFEKDIVKLAKADFDRTAALADKFSRPEIRLMARMILINSLLPSNENPEMLDFSSIEVGEDVAKAPIK